MAAATLMGLVPGAAFSRMESRGWEMNVNVKGELLRSSSAVLVLEGAQRKVSGCCEAEARSTRAVTR